MNIKSYPKTFIVLATTILGVFAFMHSSGQLNLEHLIALLISTFTGAMLPYHDKKPKPVIRAICFIIITIFVVLTLSIWITPIFTLLSHNIKTATQFFDYAFNFTPALWLDFILRRITNIYALLPFTFFLCFGVVKSSLHDPLLVLVLCIIAFLTFDTCFIIGFCLSYVTHVVIDLSSVYKSHNKGGATI